jgi:hypothetical protein
LITGLKPGVNEKLVDHAKAGVNESGFRTLEAKVPQISKFQKSEFICDVIIRI